MRLAPPRTRAQCQCVFYFQSTPRCETSSGSPAPPRATRLARSPRGWASGAEGRGCQDQPPPGLTEHLPRRLRLRPRRHASGRPAPFRGRWARDSCPSPSPGPGLGLAWVWLPGWMTSFAARRQLQTWFTLTSAGGGPARSAGKPQTPNPCCDPIAPAPLQPPAKRMTSARTSVRGQPMVSLGLLCRSSDWWTERPGRGTLYNSLVFPAKRERKDLLEWLQPASPAASLVDTGRTTRAEPGDHGR